MPSLKKVFLFNHTSENLTFVLYTRSHAGLYLRDEHLLSIQGTLRIAKVDVAVARNHKLKMRVRHVLAKCHSPEFK